MSAIVFTLADVLMRAAWQAAVVAAVVAVARLFGSTPRYRHGLACAGMIAIAVVPVLSHVVGPRAVAARDLTAALVDGLPLLPHPGAPERIMVVVALVWAVGASLMSVRMLGGWWVLRRYVRETDRGPQWLVECTDRLARSIGLRFPVVVRTSRDLGPAVLGLWRPVIVVPIAALTQLSRAAVEAVLVHELAHVRRLDPLINALQRVCEVVYFFHPAVWWLSRMLAHEREFCCDDVVLARGGQRRQYARALLDLAEASPPIRALAAQGDPLMTRIQRILDPQRSHRSRGVEASLAALALAVLGLGFACDPEPPPAAEVERVEALDSEVGVAVTPSDATAGEAIAWMPGEVQQWSALFETAASTHGVDAKLLAVITLVESRGNPQAVSPSGARGLMQIMPATAQRIADERGLSEHDTARLADPAYNIDFGAWLLAEELAEFGSDDPARTVELAAAAYNGGEEVLRAHLERGQPLPEETERYRRRVSALWAERDRDRSEVLRAMRTPAEPAQ